MLVDKLLTSADRVGERVGVGDSTGRMSYPMLVRFADVMRRHVESQTQAPHVGILMPSSCAFAGTFYGVLWAGRTAVPLNFLLQPAELAAVIADAGLDTIYTVRHFSELAAALPVKSICIEDLAVEREIAAGGARRIPPPPSVSPDEVAVLLYTSGTSGDPKGVCQTYDNLASNIAGAIQLAQLTSEQRFLGVLPLFHSFGLTAMLMVPVALGSEIFYMARFHPLTLLTAIHEQKSTITMMVASMYAAMLKAKKGSHDDLASIQYAISGGEALPDAVFHAFREKFQIDVLQGYGMTEASPVVSLNMPWSNRVGTVGLALPNVSVQPFDDAGNALPLGTVGELWVRGPNVMQGYYRKEAETRAVITPDGWYKTGDMGKVDAEGYITITGRKKEMIIVGGDNVYPREVEAALEEHAAVAEAAVIGQTDPMRGEVVIAFVTLREGVEATELALRDFCRDRIAGYKIPRRVIFSQDLPRGPTGKILKRKLADLL